MKRSVVKAGLVGPEQVANAKTFLAEQEILFIDQEEELDNQSDFLAALIGYRPEPNSSRFKTTEIPPAEFPIEPVDAMIDYALQSNLQLKAISDEMEATNTLVDAAEWSVWPSLDLLGSISGAGLGGDPQNVIFGTDTLATTTNGSYGDMLNQVIKRDYPGWSIGFEFSLPIGLRSDIGENPNERKTMFKPVNRSQSQLLPRRSYKSCPERSRRANRFIRIRLPRSGTWCSAPWEPVLQ